MTNWKFVSFIEVDKEFKVQGLNIWNFYWQCSDRKVEVRGPEDREVYFFKQYQIKNGNKEVEFVAGEFSDLKIGLYLRDDWEKHQF